ncbi:MAG: 50S ribosomal protein L10 [Clostridia bacterium]|nr:50S ribosomal protein L10 [Clostridia bacterium]MBQ8750001.1 50S ribosomal protein L10 [Clostridia bacterium]
MSANRDAKVELVKDIKDKIQNAKSVVIVNYGGITVAQDTELRTKFRAENVEYRVYKNRLILRALNELGYEVNEDMLQGTNSVAISYDDETAGPRIINDFMKKNKIMEFKFGVMNAQVVDGAYVQKIASLPNKPALIGQLLSVLNGPIRGVCVALNAVAEKGE